MVIETQEITKALVQAQSEFTVIKKDVKGQVGNQTYMYANLNSIIEAIRPALTKNGLCFTQLIQKIEGETFLVTRLLHISGQSIESHYALPDPKTANDPKGYGKLLTYARRYSLDAIMGTTSEEDTDGNGGENQNKKQANPRPQGVNNGKALPNAAPPARKLYDKELKSLWGRLNVEFGLTSDEVKFLCKTIFKVEGLGGLNFHQGQKLMAEVENEGKSLIARLEGQQAAT